MYSRVDHSVVVVSATPGALVIARSRLVVMVTHNVVVASAETACTYVVRTVVSGKVGCAVDVVSTFAAGVVWLFSTGAGCTVRLESGAAAMVTDTALRIVVTTVVHCVDVASAATANTNVVTTFVI